MNMTKDTNKSENLTSREIEILKLIGQGASSKEAGEKLFISKRTVEFHLMKAYKKIQQITKEPRMNRVKAYHYATNNHLLD